LSGDGPRYGVLVVAYGAPLSLDDVEPYLLDVRGGRPTSPEMVAVFKERYSAIGGRSPLLARTEEQALALAHSLGNAIPVYVGMRHWHPYIAEVFDEVRSDGVERLIALALAPHFSTISIGAYQRSIEESRGAVEVEFVREWHMHPGFLEAVATQITVGLQQFDESIRDEVPILFTAHSLPRRILGDDDPYVDQLEASVAGVVELIDNRPHQFAFQSAGQSGGPWLGPDAGETIVTLSESGARHLLICPIGFVSDHLEVLYDVDIEYRRLAKSLGVQLRRTPSLNDSPELIAALADMVSTAAAARGWLP
jgi:ferrochelatase